MSIEQYKSRAKVIVEYDVVPPGEYKTLININADGDEEIIVVGCTDNDSMGYIYTIHPRVIIQDAAKPYAIYLNDEVENRSTTIKPGEEMTITTRERVSNKRNPVKFKHRLIHRDDSK